MALARFPTTPRPDSTRYRTGLSGLLLALAGVSLLAPLLFNNVAQWVGGLLVSGSLVELVHGFRRTTWASQRAAWLSGGITLGMGGLLFTAPSLAGSALVTLLAGWFAIDAARNLITGIRQRSLAGESRLWWGAAAANGAAAIALFVFREQVSEWMLAMIAAVRLFETGTSVALAPAFSACDSGRNVIHALQLNEFPELDELARRITEEESARSRADWGWICAFLGTLLAIHLGRMGLDRTLFGLMSPGFALLGDVLLGLVIAFVLVIPAMMVWRRLTRWPERRAWQWCLAESDTEARWPRRLVRHVLLFRLRFTVRLAQSRYSVRAALSRGLQIGLPPAAFIAATVPMWGMSWYFDTENWAAGIWNSWAEERTDTWREAMAAAVAPLEERRSAEQAFEVQPGGVPPRGDDFSFVIIGDTGEGDASQHVLRATLLDVVKQPEVKFVVISSDVVYPTGAMKDYERNFWLPFMGITKPVYAIPGNHDWYDALDGFTATFFEPEAARLALRARVAADHGLSSTTDARIEELIGRADELQDFYRVPVGGQRAPFFQLQTEDFALFAVDTGVARRIDAVQERWLRRGLEAARGKTKLVILGHPFYAGGHYQAEGDPEFADLHRLLRDEQVEVVMAGDTHDLEHYVDRWAGGEAFHFVNGGGGAYLSYGTALAWPNVPASDHWSFYPSRELVEAKIDRTTPVWKRPAWWWTKRWNAWPFSAEWLSAAFDVNTAPFHQSFVEVRVERSQGRLRIIPHGVHGRLRWAEFQTSWGTERLEDRSQELVEWTVPLAKRPRRKRRIAVAWKAGTR